MSAGSTFGRYEVEQAAEPRCALVNAGGGRAFLVLTFGTSHPTTLIFLRSKSPDCFVQVSAVDGAPDPERAVTGYLFGRSFPANPINDLKRDLERWRSRAWALQKELDMAKKPSVRKSGPKNGAKKHGT